MVPLPNQEWIFMQIICPFYTRSTYTKEAVDLFIDHSGQKVKYYGTYQRKFFTQLRIYRYYQVLPTGQKKLFRYCLLFFSAANRSHLNTSLLSYACR